MLVCPGHLRWKVALLCTPPFGGASGLRAVCAAHVSLSGLSTSGLCCGDWRPVSTHAARCAVGVPLVLGFRDTSGSCQDAPRSGSDAAADGPGLGARCGWGKQALLCTHCAEVWSCACRPSVRGKLSPNRVYAYDWALATVFQISEALKYVKLETVVVSSEFEKS